MLGKPPAPEATGEAWLLSDQGDSCSLVAEGPLAGTSLRQLMAAIPDRLLGPKCRPDKRFPILLKFIDAAQPLSVQVHPNDAQARSLEPDGPGIGKTEAWYILDAEPGARIYAGLAPGATFVSFSNALRAGKGIDSLIATHPALPGQCYFLRAGTIHAIGAGLLLFEIQQTSDVTYRLDDWGRIDVKTGKPRELHVDKGLACTNFGFGPCLPSMPNGDGFPGTATNLAQCEYFTLNLWRERAPFRAGAPGRCTALVGVQGRARIVHHDQRYCLEPGQVWLLPAEVGECLCLPDGDVVLLECHTPDPPGQGVP